MKIHTILKIKEYIISVFADRLKFMTFFFYVLLVIILVIIFNIF
jgi:hypothetical protein